MEPASPPPAPGSDGFLGRTAVVFYAALVAGALVLSRVTSGRYLPRSLTGGRILWSLALGAGLTAAGVAGSRVLLRGSSPMRWVADRMREILGPMGGGTVCLLALTSGFAEELFFRGALQPVVGYVIASASFGLVHVGPDRRYLPWTGFALVVGFALGGIVLWSGSLWGAVVAHVVLNAVNLGRIARSAPAEGDDRTAIAPDVETDEHRIRLEDRVEDADR